MTFVTVIICGIAHTDVGEAGPGENQGTEAFAQAFKRACSQFGLGRYLYDLEKAWVPFDKQKKRIDLDPAGIWQVVLKMYLKAGLPVSHDDPHPQEKTGVWAGAQQPGQPQPSKKEKPQAATSTGNAQVDAAAPSPQQLDSIKKMCGMLKRPHVPTVTTFADAKTLITTLSQELAHKRKAS